MTKSSQSAKGKRKPAAPQKIPHILHCHSSFSRGGKEARATQLMNAFGDKLHHSVVSGVAEEMGAAQLISSKVPVRYPKDFPALTGKPFPNRLHKLAKALKPYDLVLTYNWGAIDVVMAHTLFADALGLPPLIHHEDGFNEDEADKLKWTRNWYRRIALGKASGLVVPSERLEEIALTTWMQPLGRVKRYPNGIDTAAYAKKPRRDALRVVKHDGERWVGTLAGLRPVKQLPQLVAAFAKMPEPWQLVILGTGPEKDAIQQKAQDLDISHRVHLPGHVDQPAEIIGLFDIFALSSQSEQFPISVVEAMAAGLPIVAPAVGDIASMVSDDNAGHIVPPNNAEGLGAALRDLADNEALRASIGRANMVKARAEFDQKTMIDRYKRLYSSALGYEI